MADMSQYKTYKCVATFEYEFEVIANDSEAAEQIAFESLADDATTGDIRTDIFKSDTFPMMVSVDVTEKKREE